MQETKTIDHIDCIKKYFRRDLSFNNQQNTYINHNCSKDSLDNLFQELYKRFAVPLYIPILILISTFLILFTKENRLYQRSRFLIFLTGIILIILSETMLRFLTDNFLFNLKITIIPVLIFVIIYIVLNIFIKKNIGTKT